MLRPMLSLRLMTSLAMMLMPRAAVSPEPVAPASGWSGPWGRMIDPSRTHCIQAPLSMRIGHKSRKPHQVA
jgi:hypothetical protein